MKTNLSLALLFGALVVLAIYQAINTRQANESLVTWSPNSSDKQLILDFHAAFVKNEFKKYSQNKEDGVIAELIAILNLNASSSKYFVEIGTQSGVECNSRYLRESLNWTGVMFDGGFNNAQINLNKETIAHDNVLSIFDKYKVKNEIDILSEDTDYADYWILESILTRYKPKVVVHEVNQQPPDKCITVPKPNKVIFWDGSEYHGGSVCAFYCLAKRFNYTMVYCESHGVNCFWIRDDLLQARLNISPSVVQSILSPIFLFRKPSFVYAETKNKWLQIAC
jgi:hypothetical protein